MPLQVDTRRLNRIIANVDGNTTEFLRTVAFAVERRAKINAPVDTGALRASIYTRIGNESNDMPDVPGNAGRASLPTPGNATTAHIGPSVNYGIFVELGSGGRAARPFLADAVRTVEDSVIHAAARRVATDE